MRNNITKSYWKPTNLRATALTAALLAVYGTTQAANIDIKDGTVHTVDGGTYDFVKVYAQDSKRSQPTVLFGANLIIGDPTATQQGAAVTAKGGTINLADTIINVGSNTDRWGLLATSSPAGEADTRINGDNLTVEARGKLGYGAHVYVWHTSEKTKTNRTSVSMDLRNSGFETWGEEGHGLMVIGNYGEVTGDGSLQTTNVGVTTHGKNSIGVRVIGGGKATLVNTNIRTTDASVGGAAHGISAASGSTITMDGGAVTVEGSGSGLYASTGNITFKNGSVTTQGMDAYGARIQNGSHLILENSTLTSEKSYGLVVGHTDATSAIKNNTATVKKSTINTGGRHGVYVTEGSATLENSSVISTSTIADSKAVTADFGAKVTISDSEIRISASGAGDDTVVAVQALEGGSVTLKEDTGVFTTGAKAFGLRSTVDLERDPDSKAISSITASSTSIETSGAGSHAMAAYWGGTISADNTRVKITGADAYGAHTRDAGKVTLTSSSIATSGARSVGAVAESAGPSRAAGSLDITNSSIRTTGAEAHGIALRGGGSAVTMTGGSIATASQDAAGLYASNRSTATLTGVTVTSAGPSIISRFNSETAQTITLGSGTYMTENNGTLLRVDRESGGANGTVNLNLNAGSFASGNIVDKTATGKVKVGRNGGHWAGIVVDSSTKTVAPDAAPEANFNTPGSVSIAPSTSGAGPTTFTGDTSIGGSVSLAPSASTVFQGSTTIADHMVGQQGASTQFNGVTNIGQSVTGAQNSTFTFSGASTTIGGSIAGTTGSTMTFAGGATIGGNVEAAGDGGSFVFSQTAPTTIGGNVQLGQGASLKGGTVGTPITIAGAAVVNSGAVLGGNLVVTGPLSGTGGTLSPGNSVGTQRYGTSGEFSGAYVAEVNAAGKSDLIIIDNGNLNLAGVDLSVSQENGNGGYVLNHDYTIVQTVNGNMEGTFKSAALDSTFAGTLVNLDPVKYSQKDAKVSLSVDTSKVSAKRSGLSANQNATLDGVISVAGRNASADAALLSTDTGAAMNQLSGELHASTQSALLNSSSLLTNTIAKRMRGNVGAGMVAGAPVAQSSGSMPAGAMPSSAAYPLWAEVVGNWSSLDGNNNAAKVKSDTAGLFIGGDVGVGKGWRLGATLGFTDGKIKVNDRSSRSDVRSYTAAIYGGNSWATAKGSVNFLAGAGYTRHDVDSRRTVTVGGNQTLKADYKANTTHLFTELGYAMPVGKASIVEPYLGLAWISQRAKGFNESGGSAALSGQSQTDNVTTFTLGARGKTTIEAGRHEVRLSAGAGWRHAAGDVDASRKMSFIQGNGATFQVAGAPIAKNAAVVDLGAEMTMGKNAAMGLAYSGQFGNGNTDSTGSLYLKYRFK